VDEKLKPCPFCSDPMWQHGVSGIIRHVDQSKSNECILAHTAFIDLKAWNTRTPSRNDVLEEAVRLFGSGWSVGEGEG